MPEVPGGGYCGIIANHRLPAEKQGGNDMSLCRIPLLYCVYDHPSDYPDKWVARAWAGDIPTRRNIEDSSGKGSLRTSGHSYVQKYTNYPRQALYINSESKTVHPTQKPVALFEYLIKTYTNEGEIVLDNCIGSGTTAVAALNTGRFFIGIEKEPKYCEIARQRLEQAQMQQSLFG